MLRNMNYEVNLKNLKCGRAFYTKIRDGYRAIVFFDPNYVGYVAYIIKVRLEKTSVHCTDRCSSKTQGNILQL